ncbi:MAG TPA: hypothetical protein GX505_05475 [Clostridiales bacterium]|nr:hypothetical protein [Clostridiales bacterium]
MKKLLILFLALVLLISVPACSTQGTGGNDKGSGNSNLEGSLDDILAQIYEKAELEDSFREYIETGLMKTEITAENCASYFGVDLEFESGLASEPVMMPSAYLLALIRVKEGADIEKIKADIKANADPMRWICVGVDPANVFVENVGDVVVLIMSDNAGQALKDAFLSLGK